MKPLLKWAGGKTWHVDTVRLFYNGRRRIVEPFCGSCAMSFGLGPKLALLNDINPHLINFYKQVQRGVPFDLGAFAPGNYLADRAYFNRLVAQHLGNSNVAAELFFVLNHWGFNGLWRVNKKGEFNVPPRPKLRPLPTPNWGEYVLQFNHWMFTCGDFEQLNLHSGDFIYADPPYHGTYDAAGFGLKDHVRLANWLRRHSGPVCVTNAATDQMKSLYADCGFTWVELDAPQRMHQSQGGTGKIVELMAFNRQFAIDTWSTRTHDRQETLQ